MLVNSGTPASPEPRDVRRFLRGLLSDPRVVELPRALWLPILYGFILPFRPGKVAKKYRKIWTSQGSPLVAHSNKLRAELATVLAQRTLAPFSVEVAYLYARPSVNEALAKLRDSGAIGARDRVLLLLTGAGIKSFEQVPVSLPRVDLGNPAASMPAAPRALP